MKIHFCYQLFTIKNPWLKLNQIAICESFLELGHMFIVSRKGGVHLVHNNYVYRSNLRRQGRELNKIYWECIYNRSTKCRGRLKSIGDSLIVTNGIYLFTHNSVLCFVFLNSIHLRWFFLFFFSRFCLFFKVEHNHEEDVGRVEAAQQAGCLIFRTISSIGAKIEKFSFDCTMLEENL